MARRNMSNRYMGDKSTKIVHDLEKALPECGIDEVLSSGDGEYFSPDSLTHARIKGYVKWCDCITNSRKPIHHPVGEDSKPIPKE